MPRPTNALLAEWEADYGQLDNCVTGQTSVTERLRALEAKVGSVAVITPGDFIRVAKLRLRDRDRGAGYLRMRLFRMRRPKIRG
jgi:hypothetical protein